MSDTLTRLSDHVAGTAPAPDTPDPSSHWNPPLCGDLDMRIREDGSWWHEGRPIQREALVRLFCSVLRREQDGDYYLVTPVEKWRIRVDAHALRVIDIEHEKPAAGEGRLHAQCATGQRFLIGEQHPLAYAPGEHVPHLRAHRGLTASLARPVWYRLVESAAPVDGTLQVRSGAYRFALDADAGAAPA